MNNIIDEARDKIPIALVGNKSDWENEKNASKEEGKKLLKNIIYNILKKC